MAKRDYYEILGVSKSASAEEIKKAYRKAAMQFHPDRAKGEAERKAAEEQFKEVNEAYDVLKDSQKKAAYDQYGQAAFDQAAGFGGFGQGTSGFGGGGATGNPFEGFGFNFSTGGAGAGGFAGEDLFDMFFGGNRGARQARASATGGRDLHYQVSISFDKAVHGGEEIIRLSHLVTCQTCHGSGSAPDSKPVTCDRCGGTGEVRQMSNSIFGQFATVTVCPKCQGEGKIVTDPCKTCNGKGRVSETEELMIQIPAGVDTGTEIRFSGKGDAGVRGGRPGDLYLEFKVQPHPYFSRRGNDIFVTLPLTLSEAALGTTVEVPTIDGATKVKVPAGVVNGTEIRLSGKGVKRLGGNSRGDELLAVKLEMPRPSGEEKRLLEQLGKVEKKPKRAWE